MPSTTTIFFFEIDLTTVANYGNLVTPQGEATQPRQTNTTYKPNQTYTMFDKLIEALFAIANGLEKLANSMGSSVAQPELPLTTGTTAPAADAPTKGKGKKAAEAPPVDTKPAAPTVTKPELQALMKTLAQEKNKAAEVQAAIKEFGVPNLSSLSEDKYAELKVKLEALNAGNDWD